MSISTNTRTSELNGPALPLETRLKIQQAWPYLLGLSLSAAVVLPAQAITSAESGAVNATIDLVRQFSQRVSLAQSAGYLDEQVAEVNGQSRAARMSPLALSFAPADVRAVPAITGLPRRDGAGRPMGYCAWDNSSATAVAIDGTLAFLAGNLPGNTDKLVYAVISPGRDGRIETSCADVLLLQQTIQSDRGGGLGDDLVYARRPRQESSRTFRSAVGTASSLPATGNTEGDVRLVMDSNILYSYKSGAWQGIAGTSSSESFSGDGKGNLSYSGGKVTVSDFEAATAAITTSLTVSGGAIFNGNVTVNSTLTATNLAGNGSAITSLNASNITTGVLPLANGGTGLGAVPGANQILLGNGSGYTLSTLTAGSGIAIANMGGLLTLSNTGLVSVSSPMGTINTSVNNGAVTLDLPQSIASTSTPTFAGLMLNGGLSGSTATFSGAVNAASASVSGNASVGGNLTVTGTLSANGSNLSNLNATNITSGTLAVARGGTGLTTTPSSGQLLIGNNTGYTLSTLTAGTGIAIDNAAGSITVRNTGVTSIAGTANQIIASAATGALTLSLPQNIATTSSPTFAGLTLTGALQGTTATFTGAMTASSLTLQRLDLSTTAGVSNANLIVGSGAMPLTQSGSGSNTAIGINALAANTTGSNNLAIGREAMFSNTQGFYNIAVGQKSLRSVTTGFQNIAVGSTALNLLVDGAFNVAVGHRAMEGATAAYDNTLVGHESGLQMTTGEENAGLGYQALLSTTTGVNNTGMGSHALWNNTTGSNNSGLGYDANVTVGTLNYATAIGAASRVATSNTIALGRNSTTDQVVIGTDTRNDTTANTKLYVNGVSRFNGDVYGTALNLSSNASVGGNLSVTGTLTVAGQPVQALNKTNIDAALTYAYDPINYPENNLALGQDNLGSVSGIRSSGNIAIGEGVLRSVSNAGGMLFGQGNSGVGYNALYANTTGYSNTSIGTRTLNANTTGFSNTAVGSHALNLTTTGYQNTAIGHQALFNNTTGYSNVAVGRASMMNNTTGFKNTVLGFAAEVSSGGLSYATVLGAEATVASSNTIALGRNSTTDQVVIGTETRSDTYANTKLYVNGVSSFNGAMYGTTGTFSSTVTAGNLSALRLDVSTSAGSVSIPNIIVGTGAMTGVQSGNGGNTALGSNALASNTTGWWNLGIGRDALKSNTIGDRNMAMGTAAMTSNTTGSYNAAIGANALGANTTGLSNTAIGFKALEQTAGNYNTAIGSSTGRVNTNGSNNLFIGYNADTTANTLGFAAAIGAESKVATSDTLVLGRNSSADQVVIGSDSRNGSHKLYVNGTALSTAWNTTSDRRLKTDIASLDSDMLLDKLGQFSAHRYRYIANPEAGFRIGVIAQDIQPLFPEVAAYNGGAFLSVDYNALGAMAAAGVGRLNSKFNTFEKFSRDKFDQVDKDIALLKSETTKIKGLEDWRDSANARMDTMQSSISKNLEKITENTLAIENHTTQIKRLDEVLVTLDSKVKSQTDLIDQINVRWGKSFTASDDGSVLTVSAAELKVGNFTAQQIRASAAYTQRLEAEIAAIRELEVDNLKANTAVANTVQAKQLNTGAVQVYAGVGAPAFLFAAPGDGHYTINTSAMDGSYATATVIVNAGQAKVVTIASEGIELLASGNTVKALAAGKSIKASWIKTG